MKIRLLCCTIFSLLCFGCAAEPTVVYEQVPVEVVKYETVPVPDLLLKACKVTLGALKSNSDLETALADALVELKRCTDDKEQIRALK